MGNLGKYQEITELAKSLGGVENLVKFIEDGAVSKAAPKLVAAGVVAGGLLYAGGRAAVKGGKRLIHTYKARQESADKAKDVLKKAFDGPSEAGNGERSTQD